MQAITPTQTTIFRLPMRRSRPSMMDAMVVASGPTPFTQVARRMVVVRRGPVRPFLGLQGEALLDDGDGTVDRYRDPDLRLHRILRNADEALDAQMLLDPFEKQLNLPATAIQLGDRGGREAEVVGQ
jgi:hypothetical protein